MSRPYTRGDRIHFFDSRFSSLPTKVTPAPAAYLIKILHSDCCLHSENLKLL